MITPFFLERFSETASNFCSLVSWLECLPKFEIFQDYISIAVVIQQDLEPDIIKHKKKLEAFGDDIESLDRETKGFKDNLEPIYPKLDPDIIEIVQDPSRPLKQNIKLTTKIEKIVKATFVILVECRFNKNKRALDSLISELATKFIEINSAIKSPVLITADALMSPVRYKSLPEEQKMLNFVVHHHDVVEETLKECSEKSRDLAFGQTVLIEKQFTHGTITKGQETLSFEKLRGAVITNFKRQLETFFFTELTLNAAQTFVIE